MDYLIAHPFLALAIAGAVVALILSGLILDLRRRWRAVFGKTTGARADLVPEVMQRLMAVEARLSSGEGRLGALEAIGRIAVQKVGFKRFNPFKDIGGDQSFAVALLDQKNDGLVISSLYTREGVRVYAKEIKGGNSKHPLSGEEKEVLRQAVGS